MRSDIERTLDEGTMAALIMLDLSAVFGVIDHPILLKQLEYFPLTPRKMP